MEVGEYVRTDKGFIGKVSEIDNGYVFSDDDLDVSYSEYRQYVEFKEIKKHSKNIIDLIEERRLCEWL